MTTCVVCLEGGPPQLYCRLCTCTGMAVHADCLEKLISVPSHRMRCAVCHASYASFVRERTTHRLVIPSRKDALIACILHITAPASILGAVHSAREIRRGSAHELALTFALAMYTALAIGSFGLLAILYRCVGCVVRRKTFRYEVDYDKLGRVAEGEHAV